MTIKSVELETVCGPTSALPENGLPEIAFAGRSNVGKSSLINTLMQRKSLARTSGKPGKTQTINFYRVEMKHPSPASCGGEGTDEVLSFYLVDLPGYGYAKHSREESAKWGEMAERYLNSSAQLRAVFLLADIRLKAQDSDRVMLDYVRKCDIPHLMVATKVDKLNKSELAKQTALLKQQFALSPEEPFQPFSAVTKAGTEELYRYIVNLLS